MAFRRQQYRPFTFVARQPNESVCCAVSFDFVANFISFLNVALDQRFDGCVCVRRLARQQCAVQRTDNSFYVPQHNNQNDWIFMQLIDFIASDNGRVGGRGTAMGRRGAGKRWRLH